MSPHRPWLKRRRTQLLAVIVISLVAISALALLTLSTPRPRDQLALDRAISYLVHFYSPRVGLISETPGVHRYWLYSDNYLAVLALSKYDSGNKTTMNVALAISEAMGRLAATLPSSELVSQYTALNSTTASFRCSNAYNVPWQDQVAPKAHSNGTIIETTANDGNDSCGSQKYVDLMLLQAIHFHTTGKDPNATRVLLEVSTLFDGKGFADIPFTLGNGTYQTYKLALWVIGSKCLGASFTDTIFLTVVDDLLRMQDNQTGGFYSGYSSPGNHAETLVNTETTALTALALEAVINPSDSC